MRFPRLLGILSVAAVAASSQAQTLRGFSMADLNGSGYNVSATTFWNSPRNDTQRDLYVISGSNVNGTIINSATTNSNLSFALAAGDNQFSVLFADTGAARAKGFGAYFGSDANTPRVAAKLTSSLASFESMAGASITRMSGTNPLIAPGLSWVDATTGNTVTVTNFSVNMNSGVDRISGTGAIAPDGTNDAVASITLNVTPVPEPTTMAVFGLGIAALIRRRKR